MVEKVFGGVVVGECREAGVGRQRNVRSATQPTSLSFEM
jgi:hypothetical protein